MEQVVLSDADLLTKELVCMTVYNCVAKMDPDQAQNIAINFVRNFDLKSFSDKQIYN